jgi:type IV pilus assembly protein PilE
MKNHAGMTLIELMIVVAVIAVIAAIALPSYQEQVKRTRRSDAFEALLDCASDQERRYSARGSYANTAAAQAEAMCGYNSVSGVFESSNDDYVLTIAVATTTTFRIDAAPSATGRQTGDTQCGTISIDHVGNRTGSDPSCWKK